MKHRGSSGCPCTDAHRAVAQRDPDRTWTCWCPQRWEHIWCWCLSCRAARSAAPRCPRGCGRPTSTIGWGRDAGELRDCPACASEERERRRARSQKAAAVRKPPRPEHEGTAGACSLCGTAPLPARRRSWCSDGCVLLWNIASSNDVAKRHLLQLHGPACWSCGADREGHRLSDGEIVSHPVTLELEHVRPLWSLTDEERTELRWWLPFNLQLLCVPCHRAKSRREAAERAELRRTAGG